MMRPNSITFKLLSLIIGAFVITTASVLIIGDIQLTRIIDQSQNEVYVEKIEAIWGNLYRSNERLKKTGLVEVYVEDFKESSLKILRQSYYKKANQTIYPFIIDGEGEVVMHPVLLKGDLSLKNTEIVTKLLAANEGDFDYTYLGQEKWCLFKRFPEWNWVIAYAIPQDIKYGDARKFRNLLFFTMVGITLLVLLVLSLIVSKFTKPITRLTTITTAMAAGNLNQRIDLGGTDEVGTLSRSFSHMRDAIQQTISELQTANQQLQSGEERYREIFNAPSDAIFMCDADTTKILDVNKGMLDMFGYSYSEAIQTDIGCLSSGKHPYTTKEAWRKTKSTRLHGPQTFEWLARKSDGTLFWVEVALKFIEFSGKRYVIAVVRDVNDRKQAKQALAEEKERLSVTLRSIGDGVITTDISGNIILLNIVAENLTGWSYEEALGLPLEDVFHIIDEQTRKKCVNPVTRVISKGQIIGSTNQILITRNGQEIHIINSGAPISDSQSNIIGVVLVFKDVTEQIKTEQELLKIKKLESIGVLAGGITHDFNNILTAILGNINLALADSDLKDRTRGLLSEAEKASLRAKGLTQQLLTFSKGGDPVKETSSLDGVIRDSANFVLHGDKVGCQFDIPEDLWLVDIDKGQMSQVIQNIVLNGRHAMPEGGIIKVACENMSAVAKNSPQFAKNEQYVKISIQDSGIGMPANVVEKIFDPYFTTKQEGNGLGLAITQSIVNKHNGYITVESLPGVGSTFSIYLPASKKKEVRRQRALTENEPSAHFKILLMDDEEMVRTVAKAMLEQLGHEVVLSENGAEAVKCYQETIDSDKNFDLVIMDLTIPGGMGGKEAVQQVINIDPKAKVIVSSGYSNDPVMANFSDFGFCAAIAKPYRIQEVSRVLHELAV